MSTFKKSHYAFIEVVIDTDCEDVVDARRKAEEFIGPLGDVVANTQMVRVRTVGEFYKKVSE